ncbi:hypothetical protein F5Y18DRAFT_437176 [Xylariaceae sp. FL1019]|nr:hypothetical protein F5Y18DRAFT_437176 [Xylariaceae sp. FL1019]
MPTLPCGMWLHLHFFFPQIRNANSPTIDIDTYPRFLPTTFQTTPHNYHQISFRYVLLLLNSMMLHMFPLPLQRSTMPLLYNSSPKMSKRTSKFFWHGLYCLKARAHEPAEWQAPAAVRAGYNDSARIHMGEWRDTSRAAAGFVPAWAVSVQSLAILPTAPPPDLLPTSSTQPKGSSAQHLRSTSSSLVNLNVDLNLLINLSLIFFPPTITSTPSIAFVFQHSHHYLA